MRGFRPGEDRAPAREAHGPSRPKQVDLATLSAGAARASTAPDLVRLQAMVGNKAVSKIVSRLPSVGLADDGVESQLGLANASSGFDPTRGDPVPGYEHARDAYTDKDRSAMIAAAERRQQYNDTNVLMFAGAFSASILKLWGTHLTSEMSRAAAARALMDWRKLTETFLEEAAITMLGMGLELIAEHAVEILVEDHIQRLISAKVATVFGEAAAKTESEDLKTKLELGEIEETRKELDNKTPMVANIVTELHDGLIGALNIPWVEYGAWLGKARLEQLSTFRLPKIFASIDPDTIDTAAAGAVVTALHESHTNDELPSRIGADPTEHDATSYFDDYQIVSQLSIGELYDLSEESTQLYVRNSNPLLEHLVGKPIKLMGQIPLFVAIAPQDSQVTDGAAALGIMHGVSEAAGRRYGSSIVVTEGAEREFARHYPARERALRIIRSPKSEGQRSEGPKSDITVGGGGLGEQYMLLRWALGSQGLDRLVDQIVDELGDVLHRDYPRRDEAKGSDFPIHEAMPIAHKVLLFWMQAGAEALIANFMAGLTPHAPEDRWGKSYFDKGTRKLILNR